MFRFMKSMLKMPTPWLFWVMLLVAVNFVAPLFFIQTLEAKLTIAAMFAGAVIQSWIHSKLGFVRLLGLGHIFWVPLVIWLGFRLGDVGLDGPFGIWVASLVVLNTASLGIDVVDVARFFLGERSPTVPVDT